MASYCISWRVMCCRGMNALPTMTRKKILMGATMISDRGTSYNSSAKSIKRPYWSCSSGRDFCSFPCRWLRSKWHFSVSEILVFNFPLPPMSQWPAHNSRKSPAERKSHPPHGIRRKIFGIGSSFCSSPNHLSNLRATWPGRVAFPAAAYEYAGFGI